MVRRRSILSWSAAALGPLLGAGCNVLPQAVTAEPPTLHLLEARPAQNPGARRDLVLTVGTPRAAPGYDTAAMVYLRGSHVLEHYATHRWADTPARLLQPLLLRAVEDAALFRAVVHSGTGAQADLRLDTEIVQLRQNFLVQPSRVELTLRVQLVDLRGRRVLGARYIEQVQGTASDDAPGGVAAAGQALARALAEVVAFCAGAAGDR